MRYAEGAERLSRAVENAEQLLEILKEKDPSLSTGVALEIDPCSREIIDSGEMQSCTLKLISELRQLGVRTPNASIQFTSDHKKRLECPTAKLSAED